MATNVGEVTVGLTFDESDITKSLKSVGNTAETELKGIDENANSVWTKMGEGAKTMAKTVAKAFAAAGVAAAGLAVTIGKQAVESYADYEQLTGGVETLFKDSADTVEKYAARAYKTAGLSANDYMEQATSFSASLINSLGGDTAKAAEIADMAIIDMSDNANKMGTDIGRIQDAYQGFAKQNYSMLDNLKLGYGGTKTEMERLLADATALSGIEYDISSFSDIAQAIHVIQENLEITGTTAEEADKTITGSLNSMKAAWNNLAVAMASDTDDMGEKIDEFVESVKTFGSNIIPVVKRALSGIVQLVQGLAPEIIAEIPDLISTLTPEFLGLISSILSAIISVLPETILTLANALLAQLPTFIETMIGMIPELWDGIMQVVTGLIEMLPELADDIITAVEKIVEMLTDEENFNKMLNGAIELFTAIIDAIPQIITTLAERLPDIVNNILEFLEDEENFDKILNGAIDILMAIIDAIPQILESLAENLPTILLSIVDFLTKPENINRILNAAVILFTAIISAVPRILGGLLSAFGTLISNLWNGIKSRFSTFAKNLGETVSGQFKAAINGVFSFIERFINNPINLINRFINRINNAFWAIGIHLSWIPTVSLPRLAEGGYAGTGASTAIIGEAGREAVLPLDRNTEWAGLLADVLTDEMTEENKIGNITINNYNEIDSTLDIEQLGVEMARQLRRTY